MKLQSAQPHLFRQLWQRYCIYIAVLLLCIFMWFLNGCAVKEGKIYEKEGKQYGTVDGLFKEQWNDYYQRGLSYSDGGFWDDAAADFLEAIQRRDRDQRRARTYGLHFIDYFPNRELGIVYYQRGEFEKAIRYLETSLASEETARAKFYLNKARGDSLRKMQLDTVNPTLTVQFPPPVYVTNSFSVTVRGTAHDNYFVSTIILNNKPSVLELAQKDISFEEVVPLQTGTNLITVQSRDLVNKSSAPVTLRIDTDREGPLALLECTRTHSGSLVLSGMLYDASDVAKICINRQELVFTPGKLVNIAEQFPETSAPFGAVLSFHAEDRIGNKTSGSIIIQSAHGLLQQKSPLLVAHLWNQGSWPSLPCLPGSGTYATARAAPEPVSPLPRIDFIALKNNQTVFTDSLFVECSAVAPAGIKDITLNGESFFPRQADEELRSFLAELARRKTGTVSFSKLIQLREGTNALTVALRDTAGTEIKKATTIIKKTPVARQIGSRLSIAIYPFKEQKHAVALTEYVQSFLIHAFVNQKRFYILERQELARILKEQQMNQEALFDQETAVKLGRLMVSEAVVLGDIIANETSVEIVARMVDTDTALVLAEKDVYWEGSVRTGFRDILEGLALKFKQQFPLCEGTIIDAQAQEVRFNLGTSDAICKGMRFLAFHESDAAADASTAGQTGKNTEILGLLRAHEIHNTFSRATVLKTFSQREITAQDCVISK